MKKLVSCLAVAAVLLAGCGKTADQKKLETDLNNQVQKLHDVGMSKMSQLADLSGQIDKALAKHDSLAKAYPKLFAAHPTDDLKAAGEAITAAKTSMDTWMKGYKKFDPEALHEQNMAQLNKDVTDLTKLNGAIESAVTGATKALDSHSAIAAEILAKVIKKK
jgi:hypothetical protein